MIDDHKKYLSQVLINKIPMAELKKNIYHKVPDKARILKYMKSFPTYGWTSLNLVDRIAGKQFSNRWQHQYTDGEFIWNAAVVYYFEYYDLRLDDDFIKKASTAPFGTPDDANCNLYFEEKDGALVRYDYDASMYVL